MSIRSYLRDYGKRQHVRPWALAAPVLILLIALPMLGPLRHPGMSERERATVAAAQSLAVNHVMSRGEADRPVFVFLLAGPYWVLHHFGWRLAQNPILITYLLTVIGVTLPAALSAGLIYRMGRMFELPRRWRTGLAFASVMSSGLFAYATALNPEAPAAVAVLWACACLMHVAAVGNPHRGGGWIVLAGLLASTAGMLEPAALVFAGLLPLVVLAMRWKWSLRAAGVLLYVLGTLPPLALHFVLATPDPVGRVQTAWSDSRQFLGRGATTTQTRGEDIEEQEAQGAADAIAEAIVLIVFALIGSHGVISHYPVLIVGVIGAGMVMHRNWPGPMKMLAGVSVAGAGVIVILQAGNPDLHSEGMLASRWFAVFGPVLFFWCGAWMRRKHRAAAWSVVGTLAAFGAIVSVLGAISLAGAGDYREPRDGPSTRSGQGGFTTRAHGEHGGGRKTIHLSKTGGARGPGRGV